MVNRQFWRIPRGLLQRIMPPEGNSDDVICVWIALVTPSKYPNSVLVTPAAAAPDKMFKSAAFEVIAAPPTFQDPSVRSGVLAVLPFRTSTTSSSAVFTVAPQVFSLPPTVGLVMLIVMSKSSMLTRLYYFTRQPSTFAISANPTPAACDQLCPSAHDARRSPAW